MKLLVAVVLCLVVPASSAVAVNRGSKAADPATTDCSSAQTSFGPSGGVIHYPSSEEQYNRTSQCEWIISNSGLNSRVALLFDYLSLKSCEKCSCENVEIYSVNDGTLLNRYCGDSWTQPIIDLAPSSPLRVKFNSKIADHKRGGGFQLRYFFQDQPRKTPYLPMACGLSVVKANDSDTSSTSPADHGTWPWMVYIQVRDGDQIWGCGGTLISDQWVATAAHCLQIQGIQRQMVLRLNAFDLITKGSDEMWVTSEKIILHPAYNSTNMQNDMVLIRLAESVPYNPACLPASADFLPWPWESVESVGWGLRSDALFYLTMKQQITLPLRFDPACSVNHPELVQGKHYCAAPMFISGSACHGEDGGPLFQRYMNRQFLIGIATWSKGGCEMYYRSNVYSQVATNYQWISNTIQS